MLFLFAALAETPLADLYAWSHPTAEGGHLTLAVTSRTSFVDGRRVVFDLYGEGTHHEVDCQFGPEDVTCTFDQLVPACTTCEVRLTTSRDAVRTTPKGQLFFGERADPAPLHPRRSVRRRKVDRPDPPGVLVVQPVDALVLELPHDAVPEGRYQVAVRDLVRERAPDVPWFPGPPVSCDQAVEVRIQPEAWSTVGTVGLQHDTSTLVRRRGLPIARTHRADVNGLVVVLDRDPSRTCALTGATGETLSCGAETVAVHLRPLCDLPPRDTVFDTLGPPRLTRTWEQLDRRDRQVDGSAPAWWTSDGLWLDTRLPCTAASRSFLELQRAEDTSRSPRTCGGRTPGGHAHDVLLTFAINGPDRLPPGAPLYGDAPADEAPKRDDGVVGPPLADAFPWLAPVP